jgi:hypothetical protein
VRRFVFGQLWHRRGRGLALAAGVLVAVLGFSILTAASSTSQLRTVGVVKTNARAAYDILVRPKGSTIGLERSRGLVRPNYLSGIFGGISARQYQKVKEVPGVEVAAPIAMIGYAMPQVPVLLDLRDKLTGDSRQLFRIKRTWVSDRGLSRARDADGYVYVTSSRLTRVSANQPEGLVTTERVRGREVPACISPALEKASGPYARSLRTDLSCFSRVDDSANQTVGLSTLWSFPLMMAAVDPAAEAALTGLDDAVVSGRFLRSADKMGFNDALTIPVLTPSRAFDEEKLELSVDRLPSSAAQEAVHSALDSRVLQSRLQNVAGTPVEQDSVTAQDAYRALLSQLTGPVGPDRGIPGLWSPGPVRYDTTADGSLRARPVNNPLSIWANPLYQGQYLAAPLTSSDTQFRKLTSHRFTDPTGRLGAPRLRTVGEFDPSRLAGFSALSAVPLETYNPPQATGADPATRSALGGRPLLPNGNLGGYLQPPPLVLTTFKALSDIAGWYPGIERTAPISVIRIRVAGVHGVDDVSRARVNAAATAIRSRLGLDVDVTIGSSPAPQTVHLAGGKFGRSPLSLTEGWTKKGVAVAILLAVDRKSVALFVLILVVCAIFVANAATAAVRSRRTELGVLRALGWSRGKLFLAVLSELAGIGAAAGIVGVVMAVPLARALALSLSWPRLAAVVPLAVAVATIAGFLPALQATRAQPADAVRPTAMTVRVGHSPSTVVGMAATNLFRLPGRTAAAAAGLGIGIAGLTLLLAISREFHGSLVGTLLGDAVAVQVRTVDYVAVATTIALGGASVADVLYLNLRERSGEFATLRAVGWSRGSVDKLVGLEALGVGALGSVTGAVLGLLGAAALADGTFAPLLPAAGLAAAAGLVVTIVAGLAPLRGLRRLPVPVLLAEE